MPSPPAKRRRRFVRWPILSIAAITVLALSWVILDRGMICKCGTGTPEQRLWRTLRATTKDIVFRSFADAPTTDIDALVNAAHERDQWIQKSDRFGLRASRTPPSDANSIAAIIYFPTDQTPNVSTLLLEHPNVRPPNTWSLHSQMDYESLDESRAAELVNSGRYTKALWILHDRDVLLAQINAHLRLPGHRRW